MKTQNLNQKMNRPGTLVVNLFTLPWIIGVLFLLGCAPPLATDPELIADSDEECLSCTETDLNSPLESEIDQKPEVPSFQKSSEALKPLVAEASSRISDKVLGLYDWVDKDRLVDKRALSAALTYFDSLKNYIHNTDYITIVDFNKHSSVKRMYLINMVTGEVTRLHASAGRNSDPDADGWADRFSNVPESKKSSLGVYLTDIPYNGSHGESLYLDGLQSTNDKARQRYVVVHGADYINESKNSVGRSWGCPAVSPKRVADLINRIKYQSLLFIWARQ